MLGFTGRVSSVTGRIRLSSFFASSTALCPGTKRAVGREDEVEDTAVLIEPRRKSEGDW